MASASVESFSTIKFKLNNGHEMPAIGFGTYRIRDEENIVRTVDYALNAGYRMFDTASVYGNEPHLRTAFKKLLPKYGLQRSDIFVTTKLSPSNHGGRDTVQAAFNKSLDNLGLDYVDLYLIHFPGSSNLRAEDLKNKQIREETWKSLEAVYDERRAKAIGVSNFNRRHLSELIANHGVVPAVNQVEWHPYYYQKELLEFCKCKNIVLQAYCSLGGTSVSNFSLIEHPVIKSIAKKMNVTCAQVLLVWALQQDVAVIPKSTQPERITENISLNFRLSKEDMDEIYGIGKNNAVKYAWDPDVVP